MLNTPVNSPAALELYEQGSHAARYQPGKIKNDAPVVVSYCVTFLKPEMQHVYRQITALRRFRPVIVTQRRENPIAFPFPDVRVLGKPWTHSLRRFWARSVRNVPVLAYAHEASRILSEMRKTNAQVLHIYLGHIGIYLLPLLRRSDVPAVVSFHGGDATLMGANKALSAYYQELFSLAHLVLARSQAMLEAIHKLGCPLEKLRLHRTGVSP